MALVDAPNAKGEAAEVAGEPNPPKPVVVPVVAPNAGFGAVEPKRPPVVAVVVVVVAAPNGVVDVAPNGEPNPVGFAAVVDWKEKMPPVDGAEVVVVVVEPNENAGVLEAAVEPKPPKPVDCAAGCVLEPKRPPVVPVDGVAVAVEPNPPLLAPKRPDEGVLGCVEPKRPVDCCAVVGVPNSDG